MHNFINFVIIIISINLIFGSIIYYYVWLYSHFPTSLLWSQSYPHTHTYTHTHCPGDGVAVVAVCHFDHCSMFLLYYYFFYFATFCVYNSTHTHTNILFYCLTCRFSIFFLFTNNCSIFTLIISITFALSLSISSISILPSFFLLLLLSLFLFLYHLNEK